MTKSFCILHVHLLTVAVGSCTPWNQVVGYELCVSQGEHSKGENGRKKCCVDVTEPCELKATGV